MTPPLLSYIDSFCEPGGGLRNFLTGDNRHKICDLHRLLFDDFNVPPSEARTEAEALLTNQCIFSCIAVILLEQVFVKDSVFGREYALFQPVLQNMADTLLANYAGDDDIIVYRSKKSWRMFSESLLWHLRSHEGRVEEYPEDFLSRYAGFMSPPANAAAAVFIKHSKGGDLGAFSGLIEKLNAIDRVYRDIFSIYSDSCKGIYNYAAVRTIIEAGIPAVPPPSAERILGASFILKMPAKLAREMIREIDECSALAKYLGLCSFAEYIDTFKYRFDKISAIFINDSIDIPPDAAEKEEPLYMPSVFSTPARQTASAMDYLLSDPAFTESWEIHRWGLFGRELLTGRIFPSGLAVENLYQSRITDACIADALLMDYKKNDYHYFDEPSPMPPDIDTLSLMMRLARYTSDIERSRDILSVPIRWAVECTEENGRIETWMLKAAGADTGRTYFPRMTLKGCSGVYANFLLGVSVYGLADFPETAYAWVRYLLKKLVREGSSSLAFYSKPVFLKTCAEALVYLLPQLETIEDTKTANEAVSVILKELKGIAGTAVFSPQTAALLLIASSFYPFREIASPEYRYTILKSQRHDGSWEPEEIYCVPVRGNQMRWHYSRLLTSSICLRALCI